MAEFTTFNLSKPVLDAIDKMGFVEATPIQNKTIPLVMAGRDVLGQAQTGTGKTAAFGIPLAEMLPIDAEGVQALVLSPTRELAVQIAEEVHEITLFTGHKVLPVYGGQRIDRQITALKKGVQVVVGTPGRILDHLGRRTLSLSSIKMLVLDEADMMLDMGFLPDIRRILRQCGKDRQTLLFSATIPDDIRRIATEYMNNPESVSVVPDTLTLAETEQIFYEVPEDEKIDALMRLLDFEEEGASAIIFCRTKRNVDKLARKLKARGYDAEGLHGDLTQAQRDQIMQGFRDERFAYLVATDVASRGLDISHVTHVINFHVPQDPEAYVHRIGRTGRMGRSGVAITFVTPAEYWDLLRIQEFSMAQIAEGELPSASEVDERRRASRGDVLARRRVQEADRKGEPMAPLPDEEEAAALAAAGAREAGVAEEVDETADAKAAPSRKPRGRKKESDQLTLAELMSNGEEPATMAERDQRRYMLRDARKRIGWSGNEEALREADRIEHEERVDVAHEIALADGVEVEERRDEDTAADAALTAAEAARRADVADRMRAAEAAVAADAAQAAARGDVAAEKAPAKERARAAASSEVVPVAASIPPAIDDDEVRILRALQLREGVSRLLSGLELEGLADYLAIVSRLELDHDLRTITAGLLKELAGRGAVTPIGGDAAVEVAVSAETFAAGVSGDVTPAAGEMTRLFMSIGRRARVNRDGLEELVREAAGIQESDIGRIDLLHNFAFVEVRKAVAGRVIEAMHESMFKGREISVEPAKTSAKPDTSADPE